MKDEILSNMKMTLSDKKRIRKRILDEIASHPPKNFEDLEDRLMKGFARDITERVWKEVKKITHNFTQMDELEKRWPKCT